MSVILLITACMYAGEVAHDSQYIHLRSGTHPVMLMTTSDQMCPIPVYGLEMQEYVMFDVKSNASFHFVSVNVQMVAETGWLKQRPETPQARIIPRHVSRCLFHRARSALNSTHRIIHSN